MPGTGGWSSPGRICLLLSITLWNASVPESRGEIIVSRLGSRSKPDSVASGKVQAQSGFVTL
jgi:hypothetical protein